MDETLYEQLQNLDEYPNITQLELLQKEIAFILEHQFEPPMDWFDQRIDKIYEYNNLNWEELHSKYANKDNYIYATSIQIKEMLNNIIHEWTGYSQFHLKTYYIVINYIYHIWKHYEANYYNDEIDEEDMEDLIVNMMHLMQ